MRRQLYQCLRGWRLEINLDGYRAVSVITEGGPVWSRNRKAAHGLLSEVGECFAHCAC